MLNNTINDTQREIIRWLDQLDEFVISKEAIWGIGNLHKFVSDTTAEKIKRQNEKLADAISSQDIKLVQELVQGTMRGWEFMEREAIERGHKPGTPDTMEIKLDSGFHLRIAKNNTEARSCTEQGVHVWSLQEVARVLEKDYTLINIIKDKFPGAAVKEIIEPFDFKKGDDATNW